jgi:hypothetical protein
MALPRLSLAALLLAGLAACGVGAESEESLVTDAEIGGLQHQALTEVVAPPPAAAPSSHVRLAWGYLAGKVGAPHWIDWSGDLQVEGGTATLEHLIYFEHSDHFDPGTDPSEVQWTSRTRPHFDGLVIRVDPGTGSGVVHVTTPEFTTDLDAAQLAQGVEQHFTVDAAGHEVSISSIPAAGCGGFALGYERPSHHGWLAFGGRLTDATGAFTHLLRFRADGPTLTARVLDEQRQVVATGQGQLDGEHFSLTLTRTDGSAFGTVQGLWRGPSYSARGAFQGTLRCPAP